MVGSEAVAAAFRGPIVCFLTEKGEQLNPSRPTSNEQLLAQLVRSCERIRDLAWQHVSTLIQGPDLAEWSHGLPIRWELQLGHTFVQGIDAFDLTVAALSTHASGAALGSLRFLAEGYVRMMYLTQPDDLGERQLRAGTYADFTLEKIYRSSLGTDPLLAARISEVRRDLRALLKVEDDQELPSPPGTRDLFAKYLSGDMHPLLSQTGSHPGFQQIILFFADLNRKVVDVRWTGSHVQRAYFVGSALDVFGRFSDVVARTMGNSGWESDLRDWVQEAAPLLREIKSRWEALWN
jgi:hypothetical protein